MQWQDALTEFKAYLMFEKSLSANSIEAYVHDAEEFRSYCEEHGLEIGDVKNRHIENFLAVLYDEGKERSSQARIISGLRSFFGFLLISDIIEVSPIELIQSPKSVRKLPDVLSVEEVDALIGSVDLSTPQGHRNRAILETLYSCGLRVSELVNLKLSDLFFDDGYIRVVGKGNKQRLVPVSGEMKKRVRMYLSERPSMTVQKGEGDYVFLNRRGKHLTRVMIFNIIKEQAQIAGISKSVSPHTLRHSFATHMIKGGADIRVVQDMLGHESIITTEIYTHLDSQYKKDTVNSFHPMMKGKGGAD